MNIGFIGVGAVGGTLARALSGVGMPVVALAGRTIERATSLAEEILGCTAYRDPQSVVDHADLVFLTVPDDAIRPVCDALVWSPRSAVVHCSGALSLDVLSTAANAGARVGACHPFQTFATERHRADHLSGCMFGVEADEPLRSTLNSFVERIGGWSLALGREDKATYHLAGVIASNYLVTLASVSASFLEELGLNRDDALRGMLPILRGTVANLDTQGLPSALTGPVARGDTGTVAHHLHTLHDRYPDLLALYRELGRRTVEVGQARGSLSEQKARELQALFDRYQNQETSA